MAYQASSATITFLDLHRKLDHIGLERVMGVMTKANWVSSLERPAPFNIQCTTRLFAKVKSATKPQRRLALSLKLTHTDMSRKIGVPSLGGAHYFVVLLANCNCMSSVYFISEESQFLKFLQTYKALAENESSIKHRLYRICQDHAGEQTSENVC